MFQQTIDTFKNENSIALTVLCLIAEYPFFKFEAVERGEGGYDLVVFSNDLKTLNRMRKEFKTIAWILYRSVPVILDASN